MMLQRRYRLERLIGAGTTSEVWQGHDELLRRPVAVRLLRADRADLAELFLAEGRAAARLTHANVAAVYDVGTVELPSRGDVPYVVMEFVDGPTVADQLHGPLTSDEVAQLGAEVGAALAHAHGQWVTHGALTPAKVALTDVGAKVFGFTDRRGEDPHDVSLDVYALGALLRTALTGPVSAAGAPDLRAPAGLAALINRCLDPDAVLRPGSDEAALAFARIAGTRVDLPAWYTMSVGDLGSSPSRYPSAGPARPLPGRSLPARLSPGGSGRSFSPRRPSVLPRAFPPLRLRRDDLDVAASGVASGASAGASSRPSAVSRPWVRPATEFGARSAAHTRVVLARLPFRTPSRAGARLNDETLVDLRSARTTPPPRPTAPAAGRGRRWAFRAVVGSVVAGIVSFAAVAALGQPQAEGRPPSTGTVQTATAGASPAPAVTTPAPAPPAATPPPHTQPTTRPPTTRPSSTRPSTSTSAPASASPSPSASTEASPSPSVSVSPSASASPSPSVSPSEAATASPAVSPTVSPTSQ